MYSLLFQQYPEDELYKLHLLLTAQSFLQKAFLKVNDDWSHLADRQAPMRNFVLEDDTECDIEQAKASSRNCSS